MRGADLDDKILHKLANISLRDKVYMSCRNLLNLKMLL